MAAGRSHPRHAGHANGLCTVIAGLVPAISPLLWHLIANDGWNHSSPNLNPSVGRYHCEVPGMGEPQPNCCNPHSPSSFSLEWCYVARTAAGLAMVAIALSVAL